MSRCRNSVVALLTMSAGLLFTLPAQAGSWKTNAPFGATLQGDLYTPTTPGDSPAILVVIHMCTGHSYTVHGWFDTYADTNGFYLIAPDAGKQCFDSSASRDGDKAAIVTMVKYVLSNTKADASRVFAAGMSSGGCMTNTLLAVYPDVFAGGSAMPGFPAGLWPKGDTSCTKCGSSPGSGDTGKKYADQAKSVFSWSGTYGCSQQWVGGGDQYNFNGWLPVVASQFQTLSNLGAGSTGTGGLSGWTRTVYKDTDGNVRLETNLGPSSQKHDLENVSGLYGQVVTFLGLDKPTGACGLATSSSGSDAGAAGAGGSSGAGGSAGSGGGKDGGPGGDKDSGSDTGKAGNGGGTGGAGAGGTSGSAGESGSGGVQGTGGSSSGTGGSSSGTGGVQGTGGSSAGKGGSAGSGTGGSSSTSGTGGSGSGGSTTSGGSSSSGCVLGGAGRTSPVPLAALLLGLTALLLRRRR